MKKKQKILKIKVLFNASVVLSGINSPRGGSAKVLKLARQGKITGVISEIILDEVLRHAAKFNFTGKKIADFCLKVFPEISSVPNEDIVKKYYKTVIDEGDAHILASCEQEKTDYLVTLDKKHLLVLRGKTKGFKILTPGELIIMVKKKGL
jgi:putative PIN family toxin of toxin-antitoxin system